MRHILIASLLLSAALCFAAPQRGENLLTNPSFEQRDGVTISEWKPVGNGYEIVTGDAHDGDVSFSCESDAPDVAYGAMQTITFDPPIMHPFEVSGWSKSEDAAGADYCLYMDCWYDDDTNLWGERQSFTDGTHGWEQIKYVFNPSKPIKRIEYFILFRRAEGKAWFDNVSLSLAPFEVQGERAFPSVYGGNSIDYTASLSLPSAWTASVLSGDTQVYSTSGTGEGVSLSWSGKDENGRLLPGGDYTVRIDATDELLGEMIRHDATVRTRSGAGQGYVAWTESSMTRILRQQMPPQVPTDDLSTRIALAGNEYESFQVALRTAPDAELTDCTVELTDLRDAAGNVIDQSSIEWHQVGWVFLRKLHKHPALPDAVAGWWPDPLLPVSKFSVAGGVTQALWFTVYAPSGTPSGEYKGQVTITPANAAPLQVDVTATVYGFDVPTQSHLKTAFALMDGFLEKIYGELTPQLRQAYGDYVLQHKLNPDDISRTEPPALEDLEHYDTRGLNAYNVLNLVKPRGKATWVCWSPLEVYTPEFKQYLIDTLDPYVAELKERGLYDKAYVYTFDERGEDFWPVMREYFGLIQDRYGIPTLTTAYVPQDPKVMRDLNIDWNCPVSSVYRYEQAEECRRHGLQVWSYICCGPRYPFANWLADDPLVESRVIWWQAFHQKMDGFLYWGLNIWSRENNDYIIDPETDGPELKWGITSGGPGSGWVESLSGDGDLLYPGKDGPIGCIRLAGIRDGIEDYEYLYLLSALEGDLEVGREACLPVTESLTTYTRDAETVYSQRDEIARRIERLMEK